MSPLLKWQSVFDMWDLGGISDDLSSPTGGGWFTDKVTTRSGLIYRAYHHNGIIEGGNSLAMYARIVTPDGLAQDGIGIVFLINQRLIAGVGPKGDYRGGDLQFMKEGVELFEIAHRVVDWPSANVDHFVGIGYESLPG